MRLAIALFLAVAASPARGAAALAGPMDVFAPYEGHWSCTELVDGQPPRVSVFIFARDAALLHETILQPKGPGAPDGDVSTATFAFDTRSARYVEVEMGGDARWFASTAAAPQGGVFHWVDLASSETPARWEMTLPAQGAFTIVSYTRLQDKDPSYRAACEQKL
jgi:hypothetical protein